MRRLLAVAVVLASGCGSSVSPPDKKPAVGTEMLVYEDNGDRAVGWEDSGSEKARLFLPFGTRVRWLGDGFVVNGDAVPFHRVRVLDGERSGVTAYLRPWSLRPLPAK